MREQILQAAEAAFSEFGYRGTSLRDIVERAQVTKALANYYFGSKEKLFEEVFLRRGTPIAEERLERLARLRAKGTPPTPRELIEAFLTPLITMPHTEGAERFLRIQARLHMEPEEFSLALRRKLYDKSTKAYAAALCEVLPHLSPKTVYWRLVLAVGANLYAISGTHRIEEISDGLCNADDLDEMLAEVTDFVCGGMTAPDSGKVARRRRPAAVPAARIKRRDRP